MPKDNQQYGARNTTGKLKARQHSIIQKVARNPDAVKGAEPLIEDQLGGYTRIDAPKHYGERMSP
jgi:Txe/YoeB family toxin of Txe-Axe toxin-antitoxin module